MASRRQNESFGSVGDIDAEVVAELRDRLTEACIKCSERCLYQSAKWAAEMLNSLPETGDDGDDGDEGNDNDNDSRMHDAGPVQSSYRVFSTSYDDPGEAALEAKEAPRYLLAKSFFDAKEFDRCAAVFLPSAIPAGGLAIFEKPKGRTSSFTSTPSRHRAKSKQTDSAAATALPGLSQKSLFLALYARYLAGEKRKDEESEMVLGPADGGHTVNRELPALARSLEAYFHARDAADPSLKRSQGWLEYLYGVVLAKSGQESLAQKWLLRSVRLNSYHWGAWEELSNLLTSIDDLSAQLSPAILPDSIMRRIYQTHASIDLFSTSDGATTFDNLRFLLLYFPTSTFLQTLVALYHHHDKDYEASASVFSSLLTSHPHRLDGLDHYSNILYVMGDRPRLSFLAHLATSVDKFRPETCCVVGNYYSLCSQHEKAVMYFRRALTLDRNFLSAWTLMGHEYVELKNTHAAIESYRRAVDINRKDHRAWYGLGQTYEMLDMGFYALFYYQRAAGLRPYDPKMWQAVGSCYAKMERPDLAIKALKRALVAGTYFEESSPEASSFNPATSVASARSTTRRPQPRKLLDPETLYSIAALYEKSGNEGDAARYMELCLAQETGAASVPDERALKPPPHSRSSRSAAGGNEDLDGAENDNDNDNDNDTEVMSSSSTPASPPTLPADNPAPTSFQGGAARSSSNAEPEDGFGTGTTATTSRARLWLAKWCVRHGELERGERLAEELCMDGYEVEEAKGLIGEVRGRREAAGL